MAAKEPIVVESIDVDIAEPGIEPGASTETMLVTTDSFDEYEQEMSSSIDGDRQMKESTTSTISEIQEDVVQDSTTPATSNPEESEKNLTLDDAEMVRFSCGITFVFHLVSIIVNRSNVSNVNQMNCTHFRMMLRIVWAKVTLTGIRCAAKRGWRRRSIFLS